MRPPAARARPTHAGRLARWERLAFALAFAAMAAFVVIITASSAGLRTSGAPPPGTGEPAGPAAPAPGPGGPLRVAPGGHRGIASVRGDPAWNKRLATALAPVLAQHSGRLGVGVVDRATGAVAIYGGALMFHTASIEKVGILAGLLLGRPSGLSGADERVAATMIEASADGAATRLWNAAGRAGGMTAANQKLGLWHTMPGPAEDWGLTSTTVPDQLTLLQDLTTAGSPLPAAARSYELGLMRATEPAQRWGISAAASPGTRDAVKDGWLPDSSAGATANWVVNSIGVVEHNHQRLLLAVLSAGQPTKAAGIAGVEAAAAAAAACITGPR
jgi:beta-lactamase class A